MTIRKRFAPLLLTAAVFLFAATSSDDEDIINHLEFFSVMDFLAMPQADANMFLAENSTDASIDELSLLVKVNHE